MMMSTVNVEFYRATFNRALILIEDKDLEMLGKRIQDIGVPIPNRNSNKLLQRLLEKNDTLLKN